MAERCGMTENYISKIFDKYIAEGLASEYKRYWERIRKTGDTPTAAELLDFIYDKFEVDIEVSEYHLSDPTNTTKERTFLWGRAPLIL